MSRSSDAKLDLSRQLHPDEPITKMTQLQMLRPMVHCIGSLDTRIAHLQCCGASAQSVQPSIVS